MHFSLPERYDFLNRFYRLASINILSGIMVPLAGLVDIAFLGHLTEIRHLAGVILATILFDYLYRVLKFLRSSTNGMTAQAVGRDDLDGVLLIGLRSGLIAIAIAFLILSLQYPIGQLGFAVLNTTTDVKAAGLTYFYARIWGVPAVLVNYVLIGWFFGQEKNIYVLLMSLVINLTNVGLDYVMINLWGWESFGAGIATMCSQYLGLMVGLIAAGFLIKWNRLGNCLTQVWNWQALKATFGLNGNILIRYLAFISTLAIFTNLSAGMGTEVLAENGLLLQIVTLCVFIIQGVGHATQSLSGNFHAKGQAGKLVPLLVVAISASLSLSVTVAIISILFPHQVFSLLTNHQEVTQNLADYTTWLLPVLGFASIAFILEGYFIGITAGTTLRNSSLSAIAIGFIPVGIIAWYYHSNHILWLSLTIYMLTSLIILGLQLPKTLQPQAVKHPQVIYPG